MHRITLMFKTYGKIWIKSFHKVMKINLLESETTIIQGGPYVKNNLSKVPFFEISQEEYNFLTTLYIQRMFQDLSIMHCLMTAMDILNIVAVSSSH